MKAGIIPDAKLGEMAFCTSKPLDKNPHPTGTLAWSSWRYGWIKASQVELKEVSDARFV